MVFQNSRVYSVLTRRIHFQSLWSSCNHIPRVAGAPRISFPEFMALLEFSFQCLFMAFVESPFHGFQPSYNHFWTLSHLSLLQKYSTNTHTNTASLPHPLGSPAQHLSVFHFLRIPLGNRMLQAHQQP